MATHDEVHHLIRKLLTVDGAQAVWQSHRWRNEADREHELIVALLMRLLPQPPSATRELANRLRFLGLLNLKEWQEADRKDLAVLTKQTLREMRDFGLKSADANRAVALLVELETTLKENFDGKASLLLRGLAEAALSQIQESFVFKNLSAGKTREAIAFWLQNTTALPVSLEHETRSQYCEENGISREQLTTASEELNLNPAALDDLILNWARSRSNT